MATVLTQAEAGLEDIIATSTSICSIENGVLAYRGYNIDDLATNSTFGEVTYLLLYGKLPTRTELETMERPSPRAARCPPTPGRSSRASP